MANGIMALFCVATMLANHVEVNIINNESATSSYGGDVFEYTSTRNSFRAHKNGKLIGAIPTNQKFSFKLGKPILQCNAVVIAGKMVAAGIAAASVGADFAAAATTAGMSAVNCLGGGAMAGAEAAAEVPGSAAVAATIGGAGEAAAATLSAIIVPILLGALVGLGLT